MQFSMNVFHEQCTDLCFCIDRL